MLSVALLAVAAAHGEAVVPGAADEPLQQARTVVLYSLGDGSPTATQREVFHGSPVLGKAVLTGDEARQATRAFREATSAGEPDSIPRCLSPIMRCKSPMPGIVTII